MQYDGTALNRHYVHYVNKHYGATYKASFYSSFYTIYLSSSIVHFDLLVQFAVCTLVRGLSPGGTDGDAVGSGRAAQARAARPLAMFCV